MEGSTNKELSSNLAQDIGTNVVAYYDEGTMQGFSISDLMARKQTGRQRRAELSQGFTALRDRLTRSLPSMFNPPKVKVTSKMVARMLRDENIRVLAPEALSFMPQMEDEEIATEDGVEKMKIPSLTTVADKPPIYIPRYQVVGWDVALFDVFDRVIRREENKEARTNLQMLQQVFYQYAEKYYFGNGSVEGQIGRLKAVMRVAELVKRPPPGVKGWLHGQPQNYPKYNELMMKRFPLAPREEWMQLRGTDIYQLDQEWQAHNKKLTKIQAASDPGLLWPEGTTREDVLLQDLSLAQWMLDQCEFATATETLLTGHPWMRLNKMKPKAEVYSREEFVTKTRNIFVTESFAFLPGHCMHLTAHAGVRNVLDDPESWVLIGFSPFKGGLSALLAAALSSVEDKGYFMVAYADNLYIAQYDPAGEVDEDGQKRVIWASIDGEKMEACITHKDVLFYNQHLIDAFWTDGIDQNWSNYFLTVNPNLVADAPAILFNQQIPVPGMGSGAVGTAYYNTAKMVRVMEQMEPFLRQNRFFVDLVEGEGLQAMGRTWQLSSAMSRAAALAGVKLKLEAVTDITNIFLEEGRYRLDVLGYDAVTINESGTIFTAPVLAEDRIVKALIFNKRGYNKTGESKYNDKVAMALRLIKLRALYLIGGWAHPSLADVIKEYATEMIRGLSDTNVRGMRGVREALAMLEDDVLADFMQLFGETAGVNYLSRRAVPTLYEVISLVAPVTVADEILSEWITDPAVGPVIGHYAPEKLVVAMWDAVPEADFTTPPDTMEAIRASVSAQEEELADILTDEGDPDLPNASGSRRVGQFDWADVAEEPGPSKLSKAQKLPTAAPTANIARERMGGLTKETQAVTEDLPGLNKALNTLPRLNVVRRPEYYRDRPDALRNASNVARAIVAGRLARKYGVDVATVKGLLRTAGKEFKLEE